MRSVLRSFAIAFCLTSALACVPACTDGGQSSDDGSPLDSGAWDAGPPDSGPPDAAAPELTIVVYLPLEGTAVVGCGAGFTAAQVAADPLAAITEAPQRCKGREGRFACDCDGELRESSAFGCVAALFQACGVEAEPIDGSGERAAFATECDATFYPLGGRCERNEDGAHDCTCMPQPDDEAPSLRIPARGAPSPASCEQALFDACAQTCSDGYGACEPNDDGTIGEYTCTCSTNGLSRVVSAPSCEQAMLGSCHPHDQAEESCTGYGGYCVVTDRVAQTEMRCTCADGEVHEVAHVPSFIEPRSRACRETLENTCGLGSPPAGAQCLDEGNGYHTRCTRAPVADASLVCECYLDGDLQTLVHVDTPETHDCNAASLAEVCPQIAPLEAGDLERACQHYESCDTRITGFTLDGCIANANDACVACTIAELDRIPQAEDGCPTERPLCNWPCKSIVPKEVAVTACEMSVLERGPLTEEASCLCERCYPAFGDCVADSGCTEILECARDQGCTGSACEMDPVCGPLIMQYYSTWSLSLAVNVSACEERDACRELSAPAP